MATDYHRFGDWFKAHPDQWDGLGRSTFEWPMPTAVINSLPTLSVGKPYTTRGHQLVDDPITIAFIEPGKLMAEVGSWVKQAIIVDEGLDPMRAANKELRPSIMAMRADELQFAPNHEMDHCWAMALSSRMVLTRRTVLREHTRLVPWHFTVPGGAKANKIYAYHATAFAAAYINDIHAIEHPGMGVPYLPLDYSLEDILTVTKGKTASSNVLCHGCGNAFCCNPLHIKIATKTANEEEEFCHHFLRKMSTAGGYSDFVKTVCKMLHVPDDATPCWTNCYDLESLDSKRLSMSQLPPDELLELAKLAEEGDEEQAAGII